MPKLKRNKRVGERSSGGGKSANTTTVQEHTFTHVATYQIAESVATSHQSVDVETPKEGPPSNPEEPVTSPNTSLSVSNQSTRGQAIRDSQTPVAGSSSNQRESSPEIEVSTSDVLSVRTLNTCQHLLTTERCCLMISLSVFPQVSTEMIPMACKCKSVIS